MKLFESIICVGLLSTLMTSCLDEYPESAIPEAEAIVSVETANQAVVGLYSAFKSNALYSGNLTLLPDIQSDLVYAVNGYSNTYGNIWRWEIQPNNTEIEATYGALYDVIARANFLLDHLDGVRINCFDDDDLESLDTYEGEARMARALAYSELIRLFCADYVSDEAAKSEPGVVLVEHYNTEGLIPTRATLYDSYQFVLSDLDRAEAVLPLDDPTHQLSIYSGAYFSEYTVAALRARVSLYMRHYAEAIAAATKIIDSGYYTLSSASAQYTSKYTYFEYMWAYDLSTEVIWQIPFSTTSYGGKLGQVFLNYDWSSYKPDYVPAKWVLDRYSGSDLRYNAYFYELTTGYSHALTWPLLIKYYGNLEFWQSYIPMVSQPKPFRLAEQYLIRAEAYAMSGNYNAAQKDITTLRKSRYSSYGSTTAMSAENALSVIEEERVKELYMEGFRLHDLKRWHKGFTRKPQSQSVSNGSSLKVCADDPLFTWPIPQHENLFSE